MFLFVSEYLKWSKEFSGFGIPAGARVSARALLIEKEAKLRWKLFHREECPTPERNIIDTSEWARANYRYVMGQHLGLLRAGSANLQL